jgi:hypothetical protein
LEEGSIKASYMNIKDQLADLLTKPLGRIKFLELLFPDRDSPTFPQDDAQDLGRK